MLKISTKSYLTLVSQASVPTQAYPRGKICPVLRRYGNLLGVTENSGRNGRLQITNSRPLEAGRKNNESV